MEITAYRDSLSCGFEHEQLIRFCISGRYRPATMFTPAEHPELEVTEVYLVRDVQKRKLKIPDWIYDNDYTEDMWDEAADRGDKK